MLLTANVLERFHKDGECEGTYCALHNPSDHALKTLPKDFNPGSKVMSRVCGHGVLHPDPDDAEYRIRVKGVDPRKAVSHACDRCCRYTEVLGAEWQSLGDVASMKDAQVIAKNLKLRDTDWIYDPDTGRMLFDTSAQR